MMKLNYRNIESPASETTIIFLHEGLGCIEMWRDYPEKLCKATSCKGIVYDRSGYGKSPGTLVDRKFDYLHLAAYELHEVVEYFNLKDFILYGHSDGGSIALIYAGLFSDKPRAVITEAAHAFNEAVTIKGVLQARPLLEEGKMEGLKKYHGERFVEVFYAWNNIWISDSFKNWSIESELRKVSVPNLIIQGKNDQYGTLRQVEQICQLTKGESQSLKVSNCGHAPYKEQTKEVLNCSIKFINELN